VNSTAPGFILSLQESHVAGEIKIYSSIHFPSLLKPTRAGRTGKPPFVKEATHDQLRLRILRADTAHPADGGTSCYNPAVLSYAHLPSFKNRVAGAFSSNLLYFLVGNPLPDSCVKKISFDEIVGKELEYVL
jgi:hypothetical protein